MMDDDGAAGPSTSSSGLLLTTTAIAMVGGAILLWHFHCAKVNRKMHSQSASLQKLHSLEQNERTDEKKPPRSKERRKRGKDPFKVLLKDDHKLDKALAGLMPKSPSVPEHSSPRPPEMVNATVQTDPDVAPVTFPSISDPLPLTDDIAALTDRNQELQAQIKSLNAQLESYMALLHSQTPPSAPHFPFSSSPFNGSPLSPPQSLPASPELINSPSSSQTPSTIPSAPYAMYAHPHIFAPPPPGMIPVPLPTSAMMSPSPMIPQHPYGPAYTTPYMTSLPTRMAMDRAFQPPATPPTQNTPAPMSRGRKRERRANHSTTTRDKSASGHPQPPPNLNPLLTFEPQHYYQRKSTVDLKTSTPSFYPSSASSSSSSETFEPEYDPAIEEDSAFIVSAGGDDDDPLYGFPPFDTKPNGARGGKGGGGFSLVAESILRRPERFGSSDESSTSSDSSGESSKVRGIAPGSPVHEAPQTDFTWPTIYDHPSASVLPANDIGASSGSSSSSEYPGYQTKLLSDSSPTTVLAASSPDEGESTPRAE